MKNRMLTFLVVVLILVTQSCTPRSPNNETHLPDVNGIGQRTTSLPTLDPATPLPSPGAAQLRTLLADEPGISALIADVEAAEQAALQAAITELQAQQGASGSIPDSDSFVTLSSGATAIKNSSST